MPFEPECIIFFFNWFPQKWVRKKDIKTFLTVETYIRKSSSKCHRIWTKITPSDLAYQKTLLKKFQAPIYKKVEFCIFFLPKDRSRMRVCLFACLLFFPLGVVASTSGPRMSLGSAPIFSQNHQIKILRTILLSIVKNLIAITLGTT